ncbi:MAG: DUF7450 family protein [Candidatus Binatia bacterium]
MSLLWVRLLALVAVLVASGTAAAVCGDGAVDLGEACDDGNTVGGDCCAADCLTLDSTCALGLDHFKCYQARETPGTPRFQETTVSLTDQFEAVATSRIRRPRTVCNNASKNGEPVIDQSAHLACYSMKDDRSAIGRFVPINLEISNQFGLQRIVVRKPDRLCLPSAKAIAPAVPGAIPSIDHYRCYKATPMPGFAVPPLKVTLADEFERRTAIVKPCFTFCNPVDKNGGGTLNDDAHLACYKLSDRGPVLNDMYGVVGNGSPANRGAVLVIDQTTGAGVVLGTPTASGLSGVVFDASGRLLASTAGGPAVFSNLIQIDPDTGALVTDVGTIHDGATNLRIADLGVQPGTDTLFAVSAPNGEIYTVDKTTATATLVGSPGLNDAGGLAFAPNGTLYATTAASPRLLTVDPADGAVTSNVSMDRAVDGLVVRSDGILFGTEAGTSDLIVTVATDGTTAAVGNTGAGATSDLSFRNSDPLSRVDVNVRNQFGDRALRARRKTSAYVCLPTRKRVLP